jgi:uncharacterized Zn finger protein
MTAWMTTTALPTTTAPRPGAATPLLIDMEAAGGVDLDRLERALDLAADRVGQGRYRVRGGTQEHWVDLFSAAHPRCDCGDHLWREAVCKHILAALLREGDARVVAAVGQVVTRMRERLAAARAAMAAVAPAAKRAA